MSFNLLHLKYRIKMEFFMYQLIPGESLENTEKMENKEKMENINQMTFSTLLMIKKNSSCG